MSAEEVAKAFVQHFYQTFDAGVDALSGLFVSIIYNKNIFATDHSKWCIETSIYTIKLVVVYI